MMENPRKQELLELSRRDPQTVLKLWKEIAGTPPPVDRAEEIDFENVVIPAILEHEGKTR